MRDILDKLIDRWIEKVLLVLPILLLLAFSTNVEAGFPIVKATILWISSLLIVGLWLLKSTINLPGKINSKLLPIVIFLTIVFLSFLFSQLRLKGIIGERTKYEGLLTFFSYILLYFASYHYGYKLFRKILFWLAIATIPISIYGIFQFFGLDFIKWGSSYFDAYRSSSTLGQPVVLGTYLAMILPLFLYGFLKDERRSGLFFLSGNLAFLCILTTFTRGAWIGLLIGAAIIGTGMKRFSIRVKDTLVYGLAISVIALIIIFSFVIRLNPLVNSYPELMEKGNQKKFQQVVELLPGPIFNIFGSSPVNSRIAMWNSSLRIINKYTLLGAGPDTFASLYPNLRLLQDTKVEPDWEEVHPHNQFLEFMISFGLIGITGFLWILVTIGYLTVAKIRFKPDLLQLSLISSIAGFIISMQLEIASVGVMSIFWMILGFSTRSLTDFTDESKENLSNNSLAGNISALTFIKDKFIESINKPSAVYIKKIIALMLIIVSPVLLLPYISEVLYWRGYNLMNKNDLERSILFNPVEEDFLIAAAKYYVKNNKLDVAFKYLDRAQKINPFNWEVKYEFGNAYLKSSESDRYLAAEMVFNEALKLNPNSMKILSRLAEVQKKNGHIKAANESVGLLNQIDPERKFTKFSFD